MATKQQKSLPPDQDEDLSLENLKNSAQWVLMAVAVVLLGVSIFQWNRSRQEALRQEVYRDFTTAFTPDALRQVIEVYPDQPEAALAKIQLGDMLARDGDHEEALEVFETFLRRHPRHPFAPRAELGKFLAFEHLDRLDEAMSGYRGISEDSLVFPQALFGQARILQRKGRHADAIPIYEQIEALVPDSGWAFQAEQFRRAAALAAREAPVTGAPPTEE